MALTLAGSLLPAGATGQEPLAPLQLSLSDPGARSMGLGGAFVAVADDATAALANPAGLVQLARPEVSVEGRRWSYSTPYTLGGRFEGLPSGTGLDTRTGLVSARSDEVFTGLSFVSVAYPKGKWSVAFFRHQLAKFEFHGETQGFFGGGTGCCQERVYDQQMEAELDFVSYGISGGYRISDELALGLGAIYHEVALISSATMFLPDGNLQDDPLGPTSFLAQRSLVSEAVFSEDTDWVLVGGLLWRLSRSWTLGGVFRQGANTNFGSEKRAGEAADPGIPPGQVLFSVSGLAGELPGLVGIGAAYRHRNDRLTMSFQWDRVDYSSIVESLPIDDRTIDDGEELHLGVEWVFLESTPIIALRVGAWRDPDHQFRATSGDPFLRAFLPRGEDDLHYTAGLGLAFRRFQLDVAVDLADRVDAVSVSAVHSF